MRFGRQLFIFAAFLFCRPAFGQQIPESLSGTWLGTLQVGVELRIVFHFSVSGDSIEASLDSPDQGVSGIPVSGASFEAGKVNVDIMRIGASYSGTLEQDSDMIKGTFSQSGMTFPLDLRKVDTVTGPPRPQNPVRPYPYKEQEVQFTDTYDLAKQNVPKDTVRLAGTITIPQGTGPFPALVLVTGSGPQNRDEFLMGHSPFLVLSDYLTRHGILVLRYDDRGIGKSTGDFADATTQDFANDAKAAVDYLSSRADELHISRIGIAGHSEGGIIAPMAARDDKHVDFIVLLAGTGIRGDSLLVLQQSLILRAAGVTDSIVKIYETLQRKLMHEIETDPDSARAVENLIRMQKDFIRETPENELNALGISRSDTANVPASFYNTKWMRFFLTYDPKPVLEKTRIPVLALNGSKDLQVPPDPDLTEIGKALEKAGNTHYKTVELPGLNHLFQHCVTGSPNEYGQIEETFSEEAMQIIADWILGLH